MTVMMWSLILMNVSMWDGEVLDRYTLGTYETKVECLEQAVSFHSMGRRTRVYCAQELVRVPENRKALNLQKNYQE